MRTVKEDDQYARANVARVNNLHVRSDALGLICRDEDLFHNCQLNFTVLWGSCHGE